MRDVMIDIETLSLSKNAAILSIGAVKFNVEEGRLMEEFYQNVSLSSCTLLGMHTDPETIKWWEKEDNKAAREALRINQLGIEQTLNLFNSWCGDDEIVPWSNPSTFDIVIIENAYRRCDKFKPWKFYNESCYRTMRRLFPTVTKDVFKGTKHTALDDAKNQARHLIKILNSVRVMPEVLR